MSELKNIAIAASAGAGKTYQLTNRYIFLLHTFEAPERIVALTFTRNAAGEFFESIVRKLSAAAADTATAKRLAAEIGIEADESRFGELLQVLLQRMHRLNLQTLDSFFYRVVSVFALELGLSGRLQLLDESTAPRLRRDVRDRIVHRQARMDPAIEEFWQAFKQATYGREQRRVEAIVAEFIDSLYELFLEAPEEACWGRQERIWPGGCPWEIGTIDFAAAGEALRAAIPDSLTKTQQKDFETAASKVAGYGENETLNKLLERAFEHVREIFLGSCTLQAGRGKNNQVTLSNELCGALAHALRCVMWHHLRRSLENTRGVYRILEAYHREYDRLVRRPGQLAFGDLVHLLAPAEGDSPLQHESPEAREWVDFRLDGRYDHWLLDEFQDTSRPQWRVLDNLIGEVVQDTSGRRSLFYVGDTKQCLYLWRNSDDRLFEELQQRYSGALERVDLAVSWRSAPPVLDLVNAVFDDPPALRAHFGGDATARWEKAWKPHESSPKTEALSGFASIIEYPEEPDDAGLAAILKALHGLRPTERGLSVGILVRTNKAANAVAEYLRSHSTIPVHTGSAIRPASDNGAGVALMQMLALAAHPGNTLAKGFLAMVDAAGAGPSLVLEAGKLRRRIAREGSELAVRQAVKSIEAHLPAGDRHHRERLRRLVEAARAYDEEKQRDLDGLQEFLSALSLGECEPGGAVVVETVHKAKGLEYDVVLLLENDSRSALTGDATIRAFRDDDGQPEWLIEPLRKQLMAADESLAALQAQAESAGGFGALCRLYVGLTRARRALYLLLAPEKGSHAGSVVKFLHDRFGGPPDQVALFPDTAPEALFPVLWQKGTVDWYAPITAETGGAREAAPGIPEPCVPIHPRLQLARPSAEKGLELSAGHSFDLEDRSSDFGSAVHEAFRHITWLDPEGPAPDSVSADPEVAAAVRSSLDDPDIRWLFVRPDARALVWREKAFNYVEGERFTSGVFDRVVLRVSDDGAVTEATLVDFKTDRITDEATVSAATERHRPQLELYQEALHRILGIDRQAIRCSLVFTDLPRAVRLEPPQT